MPEQSPLRSFGRIKGRPLKPRQARLLEVLLPRIAVPIEGEIDLAALFAAGAGAVSAAGDPFGAPPTPASLRAADPPHRGEGYVLEIGFGGGEHLAGQASAHPDVGFIGVEPFLNGVGACLAQIDGAGLSNVRLHQGDAREILARLPDGRLSRVYILFPDPWPKTRHWKRRIIQPEFIAELARVLEPGGEVRFATDWAHYAAWTLERFVKEPRFTWLAERAGDWREPWEGHVPTRYQQKMLGDCAPIWLRFQR